MGSECSETAILSFLRCLTGTGALGTDVSTAPACKDKQVFLDSFD